MSKKLILPDPLKKESVYLIEKMEKVVEELINERGDEFNLEGRTGGYASVAPFNGLIFVTEMLMQPDWKKRNSYKRNAEGKIAILASNGSYISSFQGADMTAERYPGAVRNIKFLTSFSGFPWEVDEYVTCRSSFEAGLMDGSMIEAIYSMSENAHLKTLLKEVPSLNFVPFGDSQKDN